MPSAANVATLSEPVAFVIWWRPGKDRWKKIGVAATRAEALALVTGNGDFWISELREARLAGSLLGPAGEASDLDRPA